MLQCFIDISSFVLLVSGLCVVVSAAVVVGWVAWVGATLACIKLNSLL